jgi:predicted GIY-YIG superfamily endonuclease
MISIYKITCDNEIYIGSTKNFNQRIKGHKERCYDKKYSNYPLYKKMINSNYKIELLEIKDCNKEERFKLEQKYINEYKPSLNQKNAVLDLEKRNEKKRIRESLRYKNLTDEERKKRTEKDHLNYLKNKEKILEKQKEKIICECGSLISLSSKNKHIKTKKHKIKLELKSK